MSITLWLMLSTLALGLASLTAAMVVALTTPRHSRFRSYLPTLITAGAALLVGNGVGMLTQHNASLGFNERLSEARQQVLEDALAGERRSISNMSEEALVYVLQELAGSREVARSVVQSVLTPALCYRDFHVSVILDSLRGQRWTSEEQASWLRSTVSCGLTVQNPTDNTLPHPLHVSFADFNVPMERFDPRLVAVESLEFTPFDRFGSEEPAGKIQWSVDELQSRVEYETEAPRTISMYQEIELGPGEWGKLVIVTHSFERMNGGEVSVEVRRNTVNLTMEVIFPSGDFLHNVHFSHDRSMNPEVCQVTAEDDRRVEARIQGGLLPYQGITVSWGGRR
ncbi:MAG: hypothetical protein KAY32_12855 [Candidatus Eisenbacteria sp.]|nr:hypothetical protein [Candidatus Eisenbacteria bacterium]